MADRTRRIMVTGAVGQIGSELTTALRAKCGEENVVAVGHVTPPSPALRDGGPYETADVTDRSQIDRLIELYGIGTIYHMAAILSAIGEENPRRTWDVNVGGVLNVLDAACAHQVEQVFVPSSMAVYGPNAPRDPSPQDAVLNPQTMYGVTKLAGEALSMQYFRAHGLDVRGLRYPGIISSETLPGGGTTDYAVEIFYAAEASGHYQCFVREDTVLPMMYMPDCIRATLDLMEADLAVSTCRSGYNIQGMSFSAGELAAAIQEHLPGFTCSFVPDGRQRIADSWPMRLDDAPARSDWGWHPEYGLPEMVEDMLDRFVD